MGLKDLIEEKKEKIINEWCDVLISTYHPDTAKFLKTKDDMFGNPVGATIGQGLDELFDGLINGADRDAMAATLDPVIRVRAIQDFRPSQATAFILSLKKIIAKNINTDFNNKKEKENFADFLDRIDQLCLLSFDVYIQCRERIFQLKSNEEKSKVYKAFRRAGLITDVSDTGPELREEY